MHFEPVLVNDTPADAQIVVTGWGSVTNAATASRIQPASRVDTLIRTRQPYNRKDKSKWWFFTDLEAAKRKARQLRHLLGRAVDGWDVGADQDGDISDGEEDDGAEEEGGDA